MKVLPDNYLKLMSAKDRKAMGKAGQTAEETLAKAEIKSEKDLQKAIISLLRLKGIEVNVSRMDKKKTDSVGWPDLTFAVDGTGYVWEAKLPGRKLDTAQQDMMIKLTDPPNSWVGAIVHSVDEAILELKGIGIY